MDLPSKNEANSHSNPVFAGDNTPEVINEVNLGYVTDTHPPIMY